MTGWFVQQSHVQLFEFGIGLGMNELLIFLWLWNLQGWESNSQLAMGIYGYLWDIWYLGMIWAPEVLCSMIHQRYGLIHIDPLNPMGSDKTIGLFHWTHIIIWLVVWNMAIKWLSIGNFIIPTDEVHHFSEGKGSTPNQLWMAIPSGKLTYLWKITIFFRGVGIPPTSYMSADQSSHGSMDRPAGAPRWNARRCGFSFAGDVGPDGAGGPGLRDLLKYDQWYGHDGYDHGSTFVHRIDTCFFSLQNLTNRGREVMIKLIYKGRDTCPSEVDKWCHIFRSSRGCCPI